MSRTIDLSEFLSGTNGRSPHRLGFFALLCLGITEGLASGALDSAEATRQFFTAENGLYVHKRLGDKTADEVMSRGVQLHDLFNALSKQVAQEEFQRELKAMRALCLSLLEQHRLVA